MDIDSELYLLLKFTSIKFSTKDTWYSSSNSTFVSLQPGELQRHHLKLVSIGEGQGETKESVRSLQIGGGRFNKQGNIYMRKELTSVLDIK